jgi:hypothetical protein
LKNTVQRHFKHVQLFPGQRVYFLCRQTPLDLDITALLARQGIATRYVGPYFHGNLTSERLTGLAADLLSDVPANTDTRPYLMRLMCAQWFAKFDTLPKVFLETFKTLHANALQFLRFLQYEHTGSLAFGMNRRGVFGSGHRTGSFEAIGKVFKRQETNSKR